MKSKVDADHATQSSYARAVVLQALPRSPGPLDLGRAGADRGRALRLLGAVALTALRKPARHRCAP